MRDTTVAPGKIRVLVVDDSRATQAIIRRALQDGKLGPVDVLALCDGEQALAAIESFAPQLLISDLHMPGMSGLELLQAVPKDLTVGLVTTEMDPGVLEQARHYGAAFIVRKPFSDEDLVAQVGKALARADASLPERGGAKSPTLQDLLLGHLAGQSVQLREGERFEVRHLCVQNLLAVYTSGHGSGICAIAIADLQALGILGGDAHSIADEAARGAVAQTTVRRAMGFFDQAARCVPTLFPELREVEFKGAKLLPREFARLKSALESVKGRHDYQVAVSGTEFDGRFAFLRT